MNKGDLESNEFVQHVDSDADEYLNGAITEEEVKQAIANCKNNRSAGSDCIFNEYIKSSASLMLPIYVRLFNVVFETAILPEAWIVGNILPIYKNKGNDNLPENYRSITLLSCMGKLFTSILSKQLNTYANQQNILNESQGGFRSNYSTIDKTFTLHSLIELFFMLKKMYCAFIDFKAAFDNVWRVCYGRSLYKMVLLEML